MPTDDRFKQLTDRQKLLLFYGWVELPSSEQIKRHHDRKGEIPVIDDSTADDLKKLGYTPKQITKMREQLENAGYSQSD